MIFVFVLAISNCSLAMVTGNCVSYASTINDYNTYARMNGISVQQTEKLVNVIDEIKTIVPKKVSTVEKVLAIYDYVAANVQYEFGNYDDTAYGALKRKKAKCVGYSAAVKQLLTEYDIPNVILCSKKANHVWNAVEIDGNWYHLDATWGSTDRTGGVDHRYFLISDSKLLKLDPRRDDAVIYDSYLNDLGVDCGSGDFDGFSKGSYRTPKHSYSKNAFWKQTNTASFYYKKHWYFVSKKSGKIKKFDFRTGECDTIYDENFVWYTDRKNVYYVDKFTTLAGYENRLFFSTPYDIRKINLDTGKVKIICTVKPKVRKLYGLARYSKKGIVLGFSNNPDSKSYRIYIKKVRNVKRRLKTENY